MERFISKVTVTGADDSIKPHNLAELSAEFPFVEFGILISHEYLGSTRFPSPEWLANLIELCAGNEMQFSGHICGSWVNDILMGQWPKSYFCNIHKDFMSPEMFKRWQINTHGELHTVDYRKLSLLLKELDSYGQSVIFQHDDVNIDLAPNLVGLGNHNVSVLFDVSHGTGRLPKQWPKPLDGVECGYAGGLSPRNVAAHIERIATVVGNRHIWIDAETKLRSRNDHQFDIKKVRAFLMAVQPWVLKM